MENSTQPSESVPMSVENTIEVSSDAKSMPKKSSKKTLIIIAVVIIVLIAIGACAVFFVLGGISIFSRTTSLDTTPTVTVTTTLEPTSTSESKHRIAYMLDGDIWLMDNDGSNKKQLTTDGEAGIKNYMSMDWQKSGMLTFVLCTTDGCTVLTMDVDAGTKTKLFDLPPFTQYVAALKWSHDGTKLGYYFTKGDNSKSLVIRTGSTDKLIKDYAPIDGGRGGVESDLTAIVFSVNDTYIALNDTVTADAAEPVIHVYKTDGTEVLALTGDDNFIAFKDDKSFYYTTSDKKIMLRTIGEGSSTEAYSGTLAWHLEMSPDAKTLAFWNEDSTGNTFVSTFDLKTTVTKVDGAFRSPIWLNNDELIVLQTKLSDGVYYPFDDIGLAKINKAGGTPKVLVSGAVYGYDVED